MSDEVKRVHEARYASALERYGRVLRDREMAKLRLASAASYSKALDIEADQALIELRAAAEKLAWDLP